MVKSFIAWGIIHILNWLMVMLFISIGIGLSTEATDTIISDPYCWLIFPTSFVVTFGMTGFEIWVYNNRTLDKKNEQSVSRLKTYTDESNRIHNDLVEKINIQDKVSSVFNMYPKSVVLVNFNEYGKLHIIMEDGTSINIQSDLFEGTDIGAINRDGLMIDYTSMHYMYSSTPEIVTNRLLNLKDKPNTIRLWDAGSLEMTKRKT